MRQSALLLYWSVVSVSHLQVSTHFKQPFERTMAEDARAASTITETSTGADLHGTNPAEQRAVNPLPANLINVWINQGQTGYGIYFKNV